jgi:hypothetical protein
MREFWLENGPPMPFTLLALASAFGLDFTSHADPEYGSIKPSGGMSIAEIAAKIQPPLAGGDTLAASREVMRLLASEGTA